METFFVFLFFGCLTSFAFAGLSMAPWVPTKKRDIERLLEILDMQQGEKFLEIGTGDARVASAVAKKFPDNKIDGIELALPIFLVGYMKKYRAKNDNLNILLGNAFKVNFGEYQHIYVFGMPDKIQKKIVPKFLREAQKGSKLYSYVFSIPKEYTDNALSHGNDNEAKIHILEKK